MNQERETEAIEMSRPGAELHSALVANDEMQTHAVRKISLFESKMSDMTNLISELRATNERQRVE